MRRARVIEDTQHGDDAVAVAVRAANVAALRATRAQRLPALAMSRSLQSIDSDRLACQMKCSGLVHSQSVTVNLGLQAAIHAQLTVARMLWMESPMPPADLLMAAHSFSVS